MINTDRILNRVLSNINPNTLQKYSYSRILIKNILADFMKQLDDTRLIYNEEPDMFYSTLKMNDSFMLKIPKNQRSTIIEDITQHFIAKLNNYLIKHPEYVCNQQAKVRPHTVIENRDFQGNPVMEHTHSILMLNPFHRKDDELDQNRLQFLAMRIINESGPFQTLTDNHTVHLLKDCHSILIDPLAASEDVEKTLGYDLKTAALTDDQNAFAILNYNSQERFYENKNAKRQNPYSQAA